MGINSDGKNLFIEEMKKYINGLNEMLNCGASIIDLDKVESIAGTSLPQEFKNLYLKYNGEKENLIFGIMAGMRWMSTESILEEIDEIRSLDIKIDDDNLEFIRSGEIINEWIPFADDFQGKYLALDLNPNIRGIYGQVIVINTQMERAFVLAESFDDFLDLIIEKLEIGVLEVKEIGMQKIISWKKGNAYVYGYDLSSKKKDGIKINLNETWQKILVRDSNEGQISLAKLAAIKELKIVKGFFGRFDTISLDILRYMTNLRKVSINARNIECFEVLDNLYHISELHVSGYDINDDEIDIIKHIRCLISLSLDDLKIKDLFEFTELKRLQTIRFCNVDLKNMSSLKNLENIESLKQIEIENMRIDDLSFVKNLASTKCVTLKFIR